MLKTLTDFFFDLGMRRYKNDQETKKDLVVNGQSSKAILNGLQNEHPTKISRFRTPSHL